MKTGKIFIVSLRKTANYKQDIHPLLRVKEGSLVITHKPPLGVNAIKLTQKDCYGMKLQGGHTFVTDEFTEHKEGKIIGGVCKKLLTKINTKFNNYET